MILTSNDPRNIDTNSLVEEPRSKKPRSKESEHYAVISSTLFEHRQDTNMMLIIGMDNENTQESMG